jgi:DNA polymerase (family 10)
MKNKDIARIFRQIADILEIQGANVFRIRAYQRAAQNLEGLTDDIEACAQQGRLAEIPGIGRELSDKIQEFLATGKIKAHQELKKSIPPGLLELLDIPSVGPKTAKVLYEEAHVTDLASLEKAIAAGRLAAIFGIKEKTIENIAKGIALVKQDRERMTIAEAMQVADDFTGYLKKIPGVKKVTPAGSLRRRAETVGDIDLLVISPKPQNVMDTFVKHPAVKDILAHGATKSSVRTQGGIQVDCRVVQARSFGAALLYFTGSKNFNIRLRMLAGKSGLKINEYGVFKNERYVAGKTEEEIFSHLLMQYIAPELREDTGEIEQALEHRLPKLLELSDIKGDLHVHSSWSDGTSSIGEMCRAAQGRGYEYIAIADHSQGLKVANGLSIADLKKKKKEIRRLNAQSKDVRILFGTEVDVDSDGNLDYPDSVLAEFDVVVAAVHAGFKQSKDQLTRRVVRACMNKHVNIIAHPTGRLWGTRAPYELDFNEVYRAAKDSNTALEINSYPTRLDLNDKNARRAKEAGVRIAINTDSHAQEQLALVELGVAVARRGWLGKADVINTLPLNKLLKALDK